MKCENSRKQFFDKIIKKHLESSKGKRFGLRDIMFKKKKKLTKIKKKKSQKDFKEEFPKLTVDLNEKPSFIWKKIQKNQLFKQKLKKKRIKKSKTGKFIKRFDIELINISKSIHHEIQRKKLNVYLRPTRLFKK